MRIVGLAAMVGTLLVGTPRAGAHQVTSAAPEQQAKATSQLDVEGFSRAGIAAINSKNWEAAIQSFEKAIALDPRQSALWDNFCWALWQRGVTTPITQHAEPALRATTGETKYYRVTHFGLRGEVLSDRVVPSEETSASQGPAPLHEQLDAQFVARAIEACSKAVALEPKSAVYRNNYGLLLARAGKTAEARIELAMAAEIEPAKASQYYFNLGGLLYNAKRYDDAHEAFQSAVRSDATNAEAWFQIGLHLATKAQASTRGKLTPVPGTIEAFEKYLQLKPKGENAQTVRQLLRQLRGK